ncbi:pyruvate kinase [Verrucomicrobiota bacterium]
MEHKKQTKIICTIADNNCSEELVRSLIESGMNVARLNTAHMSLEGAAEVVRTVRSIDDSVGIFVDTKGPEVRTSADLEEPIVVKTGDIVTIGTECGENKFSVNYDGFINEVNVGCQVLIDDGELAMVVKEKTDAGLVCEIQNDGKIKKRKSVNVPEVSLDLPSVTEKDRMFIKFAIENDLDFIAHSFVRNKQDVDDVQAILDEAGSKIKIIAKIEDREGVNNLEEILEGVHAIMVARGDLGIEIPAQEVPVIQKQMIQTCIEHAKPVITATQMLHTMIENPRPTRAEVSDVANAIFDGTDCLMLSGESAYGDYPVEAVQTMTKIAMEVEAARDDLLKLELQEHESIRRMRRNYLARAAVEASLELPLEAILIGTITGETARICSSYRGHAPIYALSECQKTVRQLSLSYGVYAKQLDVKKSADAVVKVALERLLEKGKLEKEDVVAFIGAGHHADHTNTLQIDKVDCLLGK